MIATHKLVPMSTIKPKPEGGADFLAIEITQEQYDILLAFGDVYRNPKGYGSLGIKINNEIYIVTEKKKDAKDTTEGIDQSIQEDVAEEIPGDS